MSGLSGHMMHPIDNLELTKNDLNNMVLSTFRNNTSMKEKIDGFGFHLIYIDGEFRIIRAEKDFATGGVRLGEEIYNRFANVKAADIYNKCLAIVNKEDSFKEFADSWNDGFDNDQYCITFNCEYIRDGITNILPYTKDVIIVHNVWIWNTRDGSHEVVNIDTNMQWGSFIKSDNKITIIDTLANNDIAEKFIEQLDYIMEGCLTIKEYYQMRFMKWMITNGYDWMFVDKYAMCCLFERLFDLPTDNANIYKKTAQYITWDELKGILKFKNNILRYCKAPLDTWEIIVGSTLMSLAQGYENENKPIDLQSLMDVVDKSNNEYNKVRLRMFDNKIFPLEGITFEYKENIYKFTGTFAPLNKIVGGEKYGK